MEPLFDVELTYQLRGSCFAPLRPYHSFHCRVPIACRNPQTTPLALNATSYCLPHHPSCLPILPIAFLLVEQRL